MVLNKLIIARHENDRRIRVLALTDEHDTKQVVTLREGKERDPAMDLGARIGNTKNFKPATGQVLVWDSQVPGFALRVYASGRRRFEFQYRIAGRARKMVLARFPVVTVDQARDLAISAASRLAAGDDPSSGISAAPRRRCHSS